jgi:putative membrane protein
MPERCIAVADGSFRESRISRGLLAAGLVTLAAAVTGPLAERAEERLSVHMVQHVVLAGLVAPLLAAGAPAVLRNWAGVGRGRLLAMGVALSGGATVLWHLPGPYQWALRHEAAHVAEHLSFIASAFVLWWSVGLHSRRATGFAVVAVFTAGLPGTALGAAMTFAVAPWYPAYVHTSTADALGDQQLAGVVMWAGGGLIVLVAGLVIFTRWVRTADRAQAARLAGAAAALLVSLVIVACGSSSDSPPHVVPGGNRDLGESAMRRYGCGSCHIIPGVDGAKGLVGPPLIHFGRRSMIAGRLPNTPDNLMRWIRDPQDVEPGTDMPDLGVTAGEARNIAAHLESIR